MRRRKILDRCAACYIEDIGAGEHTALIFNAEQPLASSKRVRSCARRSFRISIRNLVLGNHSGAAGSKTVVPWARASGVLGTLHHASR